MARASHLASQKCLSTLKSAGRAEALGQGREDHLLPFQDPSVLERPTNLTLADIHAMHLTDGVVDEPAGMMK